MPLFDVVVQVIDKVHSDEIKNTKHPKIGDVIDYFPAGSFLGNAVYRDDHNFWRVLRIDITETELSILTLPEAGDPDIETMLNFRQYGLDLSKLNPETYTAISLNPKAPISATLTEIRNAKKLKPKSTPKASVK
jgi:hypothetical protein